MNQDHCPGSFAQNARSLAMHCCIGDMTPSQIRGHSLIMMRQPEQRLLSQYLYQKTFFPDAMARLRWDTAKDYAQQNAGQVVKTLTASPEQHCGVGFKPPTAQDTERALQKLKE